MAIGGFVCGIVGAVIGLIPLFFIPTLALALIALPLSFIGRGRAKRENRPYGALATWGIVLGFVALGLGMYGLGTVSDAVDDFREDLEEIDTNP